MTELRRAAIQRRSWSVLPLCVVCLENRQRFAGTRRVHQIEHGRVRAGTRPTRRTGEICRRNVIADAPPWTPVPTQNLMVSRASAVGCHPLRQVSSLRRRRSISSKRQVLRTRRPTGLDWVTLARRCVEVKRAREIASLSCVRPPAPRAALVTRAEATKAQMRDNVYYGYRTAITRSGKWQFFIAGD
jgi:hypothetical protein